MSALEEGVSSSMKLVDAHVHCHEMSVSDIDSLSAEGFILVCVSDDYESSIKTIELAEKYNSIVPCIGVHPWEIGREDFRKVLDLVEKNIDRVKCLGEVGLDKQFVPETFDKQLEFFSRIVEISREYKLLLNLHTPKAWRDVYEILLRRDIEKAYFHWYTGPVDLMEEIQGAGYYIGLNPAFKIQGKHRDIIQRANLDKALTESDAPYEYKGLKLSPRMIHETISYISETRGVDKNNLVEMFYRNLLKLIS
ncbi:TatD family hydrolase [Thermogladius sp. 4427co]|uniref:TatD family hydrolase n=1 Tax=Thermogladius sp. 4427co TaxID=3450718 RepID=UPI003F79DDA9